MNYRKINIPISETNSFSKLIEDYVSKEVKLKPFISDFPSIESIKKQLGIKSFSDTNRKVLCDVITKQNQGLKRMLPVDKNLDLLRQGNTFTVCTAHQPNVFTGHLYFIYKTIHVIKLCKELNLALPDYNFVPIFYIGSEDNDLKEIGELNLTSNSMDWHTVQQGSCGRMLTIEMKQMMNEICNILNLSNVEEAALMALFESAYNGVNTLSEATRIVLNGLFGKYGLLVLDADDIELKTLFSSIIQDELLNQNAIRIVNSTIQNLSTSYKVQANPRLINLFYLKDNIRERIEQQNDKWKVVNTELEFTQDTLIHEINLYPNRFSPNVILRPLYQESILPNIAFVGGGGELSYWLQLKGLFQFYAIPFPILFLRNSFVWINEKTFKQVESLNIELKDLFRSTEEIRTLRLDKNKSLEKIHSLYYELENIWSSIKQEGEIISPNLVESIKANEAKIKRIEHRIEQKFKSHIKRKDDDYTNKFASIKSHLFPNGKLQERYHNLTYLYKIGYENPIDILLENAEGFGQDLIVLLPQK